MQLKPMVCILCFRAQSPMEWCALRNGITCCYRVTITSDRIIILLVMKYDYNVKTSCHGTGMRETTDKCAQYKVDLRRERERGKKRTKYTHSWQNTLQRRVYSYEYMPWNGHSIVFPAKRICSQWRLLSVCWEWCKMMTIWIMGVLKSA